MAWKKYKDMSSDEKKASWDKLRSSAKTKALMKKAERHHKPDTHPSDHKNNPNPGGYCKDCGFGRDHS